MTRGRGGEEQPLCHPHVQLTSRNDLHMDTIVFHEILAHLELLSPHANFDPVCQIRLAVLTLKAILLLWG